MHVSITSLSLAPRPLYLLPQCVPQRRVPAKLAGMLAAVAAAAAGATAAEGEGTDLWTKVKKGASTVCRGVEALHTSGKLANQPAKELAAVRTVLRKALGQLALPKRRTPASPPRAAKATPPSPRRRVPARSAATPPVAAASRRVAMATTWAVASRSDGWQRQRLWRRPADAWLWQSWRRPSDGWRRRQPHCGGGQQTGGGGNDLGGRGRC